MPHGKLVFRDGTAINKLLFRKPLCYSEYIDLVQAQPEQIGVIIDTIREALSWLGEFTGSRRAIRCTR